MNQKNIEKGDVNIGKKVRNRLKSKVTKFENLKLRAACAS